MAAAISSAVTAAISGAETAAISGAVTVFISGAVIAVVSCPLLPAQVGKTAAISYAVTAVVFAL